MVGDSIAGDAAGFIDPVWSSGVPPNFARYERHVSRVMDLYLKFVYRVVYPGVCRGIL
jgi:hypothetical protein